MASADGKGRTILEILTGKSKRKMTPLELQYNNPLETKVGQIICFEHEAELKGISFVIDQIVVCETEVDGRKVYHTDYCLKGITAPLRFRLRSIKNEDDKLGYTFQLLHLYDELSGSAAAAFLEYVSQNGDYDPDWDVQGEVTFKINQDDEGQELAEPIRYWRVNEAVDPYEARQSILVDKIDDKLDYRTVQVWDFSRIAWTPSGVDTEELLWIELDQEKNLTMFKGSEINSEQVVVF